MAPIEDPQLVLRAAGGDAEAFTELVRRYRDAVYGYCYHRTGSFEDARDLAQETFVRAYTRMRQLRDPERFGAWLRKIAANLCTRWFESRREVPVEQDALRQAQDALPQESSRAAVVKEALSSLPEKERLAVVLHYVNGYSYGDIAGFLEVSKDAVRGRLHRGREMLKAEVLKMTRDAFDENKLDEKFVIEAVKAAIAEAMDAYNLLQDKELSRKKTDEAAALVDKVKPDEVGDPVALGHALISVGSRELILGEPDRAHAHWDRAKSLFERAGDQDGIENWRAEIAYEKLRAGDLTAAHELYSQVAGYWRRQPPGKAGCGFLAAARALESLGLDTDWSRVAAFHAGDCGFKREDGQILQWGGVAFGFHKEGYPQRLRRPSVPGPPPGPTPLPFVLIRTEPQVGDTLRFVNEYAGAEESVLETLSDTVTTPAGTFADCARSTSRIFAADVSGSGLCGRPRQRSDRNPETPTKNWTGDVVATRKLWLAPGAGLVRMAYKVGDGHEDTSELVEFYIEEPSRDHVPLAVGNWWKWRWVEAEEQFGFRTEFCREIVEVRDGVFVALQYWFCVRR